MSTLDTRFQECLTRCGVGAYSGPRSTHYFNGVDVVKPLVATDSGMRFKLTDPEDFARGRDHYVTVAYHLIDADYVRRHGDTIVEQRARIAALEAQIAAICALLDDPA